MDQRDRAMTTSAPREADQTTWWGEFALETGAWGRWRIGPLGLWVGRTEHDWRIAYARDDEPFSGEVRVEVPFDSPQDPLPADAEQHRVAYARTQDRLELQPRLADRPVVARPETAFAIPSGEKVSVYVSSAVWVRLSAPPLPEPLLEVPTWRASDTWFGSNREGFLAYATRTAMRLAIEELPLLPHRAVTPILIDNKGHDTLNVERLSLPIPNLSIFASPTGALWTERLHLTREDDAELARVHIDGDAPPVPGAARLCGPRKTGGDNLLSRVFTGLFG